MNAKMRCNGGGRAIAGVLTALSSIIMLAVACDAHAQGVASVPFGAASAPAKAPDSLDVPASARAKPKATDDSGNLFRAGNTGRPAANTAAAAAAANTVAPGTAIPSPYGDGSPGAGLAGTALDKMAPLSSDEILWLRKQVAERSAALRENVDGPAAKPVTTAYTLDLSPGATPPVIRVSKMQGAVVTFLDVSGRPWPVKVANNYGDNGLDVEQFTDNQISIGLKKDIAQNVGVVVGLKGLTTTAIALTVLSGQAETDRLVSLMVPRYLDDSPSSVGQIKGEPTLPAGDLMAYLLRTPPATATKLGVEGLEDGMAWQISSTRMVLRTKSFVVSGYYRSQGLGDGTNVYELSLSPAINVAEDGVLRQVRITGLQMAEAMKK